MTAPISMVVSLTLQTSTTELQNVTIDFPIVSEMIGKEDNQEEVTFKVADRRKFNADGSLKQGVTLEPERPEKKAERPSVGTARASEPVPSKSNVIEDNDHETPGYDDIPGADDPASFV